MEKRESERLSEMTPEELVAEKLRRQKMQEESDLLLAKQLLGRLLFSLVLIVCCIQGHRKRLDTFLKIILQITTAGKEIC